MAKHAGFCGGVTRAVAKARQAAASGPVYALGPLAHNESLLERLRAEGVLFADRLDQVPDHSTVLFRSHGERPERYEEAEKKGLRIIDATCPHVSALQRLVAHLADEGINVVILGDRNHPEIKGVLGWGKDRPVVVSGPEELAAVLPGLDRPLALVAQTTQEQRILAECGEIVKRKDPAVQIHNTICVATEKRQEAAVELARNVDLMVVVGGKESANTRKLADICRRTGVRTITVTEADELELSQLQDAGTVGVTAGASTPDWTIKEVVGKMENEKNVELQKEQATNVPVQAAVEDATMGAQMKDVSAGDVVRGTVVQVSDDEALVDIGYKSEGILPRQEMILAADQTLSAVLRTGQELEVAVKKVDEKEGKITLSRRAIERKQRWEELENAFQNGTVMKGRVKEAVPAGMVVDLGGGFEGFMPGSMVDLRFIPDFSEFVGQEISFKVVEMRREKEKLILSRKQVLEEEQAARKGAVMGNLKPGQVISGTVKRLTNFGAFVDVGGIDGLVHVSEISWHRVENPSDALNVGDEVDVKVIEVIPERDRIGLSIRQAQADPWTKAAMEFKPGDEVEGKVTRLTDFGAFVELIPGVEGLVHISRLANHHVKQASEVVQKGQPVKVKILDINTEGKRVSLSMRDAAPRPKREPAQKQVQQPADTGTGLTLGDVFGDLFKKGE